MVFSYDEKSGADILKIEGDTFRHLFLARRSKDNESFLFCNLQEPALYEYKAINVSKKDATLELITKHEKPQKTKKTAIGWCVVDPKTIEKTTSPFLYSFFKGLKKVRSSTGSESI